MTVDYGRREQAAWTCVVVDVICMVKKFLCLPLLTPKQHFVRNSAKCVFVTEIPGTMCAKRLTMLSVRPFSALIKLVKNTSTEKNRTAAVEVAISLFYHLSSLVSEDTKYYPPTRQFFSACIEMLGQVRSEMGPVSPFHRREQPIFLLARRLSSLCLNCSQRNCIPVTVLQFNVRVSFAQEFIRNNPTQSQPLLQCILASPHLASLLVPNFSPNATPELFVTMYEDMINAPINQGPDVAFALLTKVSDCLGDICECQLNWIQSKEAMQKISLLDSINVSHWDDFV